jgi:putative endonuclease
MDAFVYIIGSTGTGGPRTYVGWTTDIARRLARHNSGAGARSTRGRAWTLLYAERHPSRRDAMSREWHLKRDRRFRKMVADGIDAPSVVKAKRRPALDAVKRATLLRRSP